MARLAEYMTDVARILGEQDNVHFVRLERGSAVMVQNIRDQALPKVQERIRLVQSGEGPREAVKAYDDINKRLRDDNSTGMLSSQNEANILTFPGREMPQPLNYGPFNEEGTLDGKIIMIGGKGDPVPVHVQQGDTIYNCYAKRDIAAALGAYLFKLELRVRGTGRWFRTDNGAWELQKFTIRDFDVLDDHLLSDVVAKLRDVPGSGWAHLSEPWSELLALRGEEEDAV